MRTRALVAAIPPATSVILLALLVARVVSTLGWRMEHDTPLLHYVAFLIVEHDRAPYRDVFETSMPGTMAFHCLIGWAFGFGDLAFRLVDIAVLGGIWAGTFVFLRRFGLAAALLGPTVFGLLYLEYGPHMSLQRDYLGVACLAATLAVLPAASERLSASRAIVVGIAFGLAASIKPHLVMGLPVILALYAGPASERPTLRDLGRITACAGLGLAVPLAILLGWVAAEGGLGRLWFMATRYLPLHNDMSGSYENLDGFRRLADIVGWTTYLGGHGVLVVAAAIGVARCTGADASGGARRAAWTIGVLTIVYAIYPAPAGKFWEYHYMPLIYCASVGTGLCFARVPGGRADVPAGSSTRRDVLACIVVWVVACSHVHVLHAAWKTAIAMRAGLPATSPRDGRVDAIAAWLSAHARPGDEAQSLDWTGGAIHGMLEARVPLATRFMYDYHFHHHVSSDVTIRLRREFMADLQAARPRFLVEIPEDKPWVSGIDSSREFAELRAFVDEAYRPAHVGEGFVIHERRADG